jgi:hypothetical protein
MEEKRTLNYAQKVGCLAAVDSGIYTDERALKEKIFEVAKTEGMDMRFFNDRPIDPRNEFPGIIMEIINKVAQNTETEAFKMHTIPEMKKEQFSEAYSNGIEATKAFYKQKYYNQDSSLSDSITDFNKFATYVRQWAILALIEENFPRELDRYQLNNQEKTEIFTKQVRQQEKTGSNEHQQVRQDKGKSR